MKSTMDKTHKAGPRENKGIAGNMLIGGRRNFVATRDCT
jgi:hypothetical protein